MLSRLRLGSKLMLAPLLVLACMLCISCAAWSAMVRQGQALEVIVQQRAAQTRSAAELAASARQGHAEVYQLISWISASFSQARTDTLVRGIHRRHAAVERSFAALLRLTGGAGPEGALVRQADGAYRLYLGSVLDVIELARNDQSISANAMIRAERAFDTVLLRLDALTRLQQLLAERAAVQAADDCKTVGVLMPVALMAALALALIVTMAVRRALLDEIDLLAGAAVAIGEGDLRAVPAAAGRDEICSAARTLDTARRQLGGRLQRVLDSARDVGAQARDIDQPLHQQALLLSRSVMAFRLDDGAASAATAPLPPAGRWGCKQKGMPQPFQSGHPYLRLAVSRHS